MSHSKLFQIVHGTSNRKCLRLGCEEVGTQNEQVGSIGRAKAKGANQTGKAANSDKTV